MSNATWRWARRSLPSYLLAHSVRSYCWGVAIAAGEGWAFDRQVLWTAALMHDLGLTRIRRTPLASRSRGPTSPAVSSSGAGLHPTAADRAAKAIVDHMRPGVTLADGVESVLLDRATSVDVRGDGYELVEHVRPAVMTAFPRGDFDRHFLRAIEREVGRPPGLPEHASPARDRPGGLDGTLALANDSTTLRCPSDQGPSSSRRRDAIPRAASRRTAAGSTIRTPGWSGSTIPRPRRGSRRRRRSRRRARRRPGTGLAAGGGRSLQRAIAATVTRRSAPGRVGASSCGRRTPTTRSSSS